MHDFWEPTPAGHPFKLWPSRYLHSNVHVQGTVIINLNKVSQALHNFFSASFTKACYNTLDWAITIFLLVHRKLERIDQVFTQTLRSRLRFKNLCLTGTDTCLYHQQPVGRSPIIFFSTDCAPPAAVLLSGRYTPNIILKKQLQCEHKYDRVAPPCDTSLPPDLRDETPQEICAPQHNSLYKAQPSRLVFCPFFKGFAYFFEGPFRRAYSSHSPFFNAKKPCFIILGVQSMSLQHLMLPLALYPFLLFFLGILRKLLFLFLLQHC